MSLPGSRYVRPAASAAAPPPVEPPGVRAREAGGDDRVARGDVVLERRRACRRPDARDLERVLHGARHTVERPPPVTPSARLVGRAGSREREPARPTRRALGVT